MASSAWPPFAYTGRSNKAETAKQRGQVQVLPVFGRSFGKRQRLKLAHPRLSVWRRRELGMVGDASTCAGRATGWGSAPSDGTRYTLTEWL